MSLQVGLPLNNNTVQQGISGITLSGSPNSGSTGKIGKCATFAGNVGNVIYNNTTAFNYTDNFSGTIGINTNYTGTTAQYAFTNGRADAGGYGYGLQCTSTTDCNIRFGNSAGSVAVTGGEGTHLAFTKSGTSIKIYKNGTLYSTNTFSGTLPTYSDGNGLGLGCFHYSGDIYPFYGSLNDFRIYDNVLSDKEIKEISRGLVLHYPLDGNDFGGHPNLLTNSDFSLGTSPGFGVNSSSVSLTTIDNKKCLTATKGTSSNLFGFSHPYPTAGTTVTYTFSGYIYSTEATTGTINIMLSTSSASGWQSMTVTANYYNTQSLSIGGNRVICTLTAYHASGVGNLQVFLGTPGTNYSLYHPKWEAGLKATSGCPNSADAAYTAMGYSTNIIKDTSGFNNEGTVYGSITTDTDTPRYMAASIFTNSAAQYVRRNLLDYINPAFTFCCWAKQTNRTTTHGEGTTTVQFVMSQGRDYFESSSTSYYGANIIYYNGAISSNIGKSYNFASGVTAELNTGYHVAITYNGTTACIYVNGELKNSKTIDSSEINGGNASDSFVVGKMSHGYTGTTTYFPFVGNISDARVYTTALSANDIKELYNAPISITNTGAVMTQGEIIED